MTAIALSKALILKRARANLSLLSESPAVVKQLFSTRSRVSLNFPAIFQYQKMLVWKMKRKKSEHKLLANIWSSQNLRIKKTNILLNFPADRCRESLLRVLLPIIPKYYSWTSHTAH